MKNLNFEPTQIGHDRMIHMRNNYLPSFEIFFDLFMNTKKGSENEIDKRLTCMILFDLKFVLNCQSKK